MGRDNSILGRRGSFLGEVAFEMRHTGCLGVFQMKEVEKEMHPKHRPEPPAAEGLGQQVR